MASIIDNDKNTMLDALRNSLHKAERIDIMTAFFYFSGFNELADELKDKKVRILVGKSIDPEVMNRLSAAIKKDPGVDLFDYIVQGYSSLNNSQKKEKYIESFVGLVNTSSLSEEFDDADSRKVFKMFLSKIKDGSLEIRLTGKIDHGKAYIVTNKTESSDSGDPKGVVIMGSSNFTYNGLIGQGELNEYFTENSKYDEYCERFERGWVSGTDICIKDGNTDFEEELKKRLWIFAKPKPYNIFIRILYELYASVDNSAVKTPGEISGGKFYNLKYQIDAVKSGVDCIKKNNGVIIADVVGLGKSIIASAIAHNLDIHHTIIIAPPHLEEDWNKYSQDFGIRGARVYSSGKIEEVYKSHATDPNPVLYIIDEAHRYRNEETKNYEFLHQLTRSHSQNKVMLLTATPYNNHPKDLFALIKLFQTPSRSTINSVDNLSASFRDLIKKYAGLEDEWKRHQNEQTKLELEELSKQLRMLIDSVIIRRSRIDLSEIKEYSDDLKQQKIEFPNVVGPELIEYDLGEIRGLYTSTLTRLSRNFICARYNSSAYLNDPEEFTRKYGMFFEGRDIQQIQGNLAELIKRFLVMRFESSKAALKATLDSIISSYENIEKWWAEGYVPIKKGDLQDPNEIEIEKILDEINNIGDGPIDIKRIKKDGIPVPKEMFREDFITTIDSDRVLLSDIRREWFSNEIGFDPKFEKVEEQIDSLLKADKDRKIAVFSQFADTAKYVKYLLEQKGYRVFLYTGSSSKTERVVVRENFDASNEIQKNDYDIIVATDALSEGFNLNRAGVIVNYDIPYNPTRVVQRVGRINRINRKMFDNIYIFNFFPTDIGEENTSVKTISTLKMLLINSIVGSDTKTLTEDETLQSYFKKQYEDVDSDSIEKSWDNEFKNIFNSIKHNTKLLDEIMQIPERSRIVRKNNENNVAISFAKRGNNSLFAMARQDTDTAEIVPAELVLKLFKAEQDEKGYDYDDELDKKFAVLREEITRSYRKPNLSRRTREAINILKQLFTLYPTEKDYISDLLDVIKIYDDLSDSELKYLTGLEINKNNLKEKTEELKQRIPIHYINQIKERAENIDAQSEVIMFTEDLRDDKDQ